MSKISIENPVIDSSTVRKGEQIYAIGSYARRANFASQQRRALNFIFGLERHFEQSGLGSLQEKRIAIIGAGLAGYTIASFGYAMGYEVNLYDKLPHANESIFRCAKDVEHRYINPIYVDWPHTTNMSKKYADTTDFPFLNWHSGLASEIRGQLINQAKELMSAHRPDSSLNVIHTKELSCIIKTEASPSPKYNLSFSDGTTSNGFDICILTVGFGEQRVMPGINSPSYWDKESFSSFIKSNSSKKLIIGQGDGATVEVAAVLFGGRDGFTGQAPPKVLDLCRHGAMIPEIRRVEAKYRLEYREHKLHADGDEHLNRLRNQHFWDFFDVIEDRISDLIPGSINADVEVSMIGKLDVPLDMAVVQPINAIPILIGLKSGTLKYFKSDASTAPDMSQNSQVFIKDALPFHFEDRQFGERVSVGSFPKEASMARIGIERSLEQIEFEDLSASSTGRTLLDFEGRFKRRQRILSDYDTLGSVPISVLA